MALGQGRRDGRRGFDPAMRAGSRRMETDGHERVGQVAAQAGARTRGTLPAQAQVAAWVRPVRAKRKGPSRFCGFGPKQKRISPVLRFFFFQEIKK